MVDAAGNVRRARKTALRRDVHEGLDESDDRAEQSDERGDESDRREDAEAAFEARDFELAGFGDDVLQLRARGLMAEDRGMDDARDRRRRARAFHLRLGETPVLNEILQPSHEFSDAQRDAVKVGGAFEEDRAGEDAAEEDQPHQGAALLHIVDHSWD